MEKLKTKPQTEVTVKKGSLNGHEKTILKAKERVEILKTYKLYIDGKFPRTESGRYYKLNDSGNKVIANICRASRKDFRDAVVAARKAQPDWAKRTAYNKSQVLYRIAETLEGRKQQFINTLILQGYKNSEATKEVEVSIDRLIYYAGWPDKFIQVFSTVNPVESSHFNFSYPEPTGVVAIISPEENGLIGLVSVIAPAIAGGNSVIALASSKYPLTVIELAEVLVASDVPGGIINLLTGYSKELHSHFSSHMDVNAVIYCNENREELKSIQVNAALNVKRAIVQRFENWLSEEAQNPYLIMDTQEIKTTWHPIGI
jgi:acyl-CoA reductase-like NAD-dependent aldehyde dehydrogenase